MNPLARRDLLKLLLRSSAGAAVGAALPVRFAAACRLAPRGAQGATPPSRPDGVPFTPIAPAAQDELVLASELSPCDRVVKEGDELGRMVVGTDGAPIGFIPIDHHLRPVDWNAPQRGFAGPEMSPIEGFLIVSHSGLTPRLFHADWPARAAGDASPVEKKSDAQVAAEQAALGLSIVHVQRARDGHWHARPHSPYLRHIDATTWCFLSGPAASLDHGPSVRGVLPARAGGATPWGTMLSCEQELAPFTDPAGAWRWPEGPWSTPRHYGWVVEIDAFDMRSAPQKRTALGRFRHANVAVRIGTDGTIVAYTADARPDAHIYKFVAATKLGEKLVPRMKRLEEGTLYVAEMDGASGRWLLLDHDAQQKLRDAVQDGAKQFASQADVLADARSAASVIGATPLDRPGHGAIDPLDGSVVIALGSTRLARLVEKDSDPAAGEFKWSERALHGMPAPREIAFDDAGNLWATSERGLYCIPRAKEASTCEAFQAASGPIESELAGPCFSPDGSTLFLGVQHPGAQSKSRAELTSHWPDGGTNLPKSTIVAIHGFKGA